MKKLIKEILRKELNKSYVINEMAGRLEWCSKSFRDYLPAEKFCLAAENYIKNELEDIPSEGKRRKKKVYMEFEKGLAKFFDSVQGNPEFSDKIIRIDRASEIYKDGEKEIADAVKLLKDNCSEIELVAEKEMRIFDKEVKLYFLEKEKYSNDNRLPTNYSALAVLFTKFFLEKGAFDGVGQSEELSHINDEEKVAWSKIAENWITHLFHPYRKFIDIRPDDEQTYKLGTLNFSELARVYFTNDSVFNSENLRNSVRYVLDKVRQIGFDSENKFEELYLLNQVKYTKFAKDYGFVDMLLGVDFIYTDENGDNIPVQVKSSRVQPTIKIDTLGCKHYVIAEQRGKKFDLNHKRKRL